MNLPGMGTATPSLLGYGCMRLPLRPDGAVDEAYRLLVCLRRYAVSLLAHRHPDDAAAGHVLLRPGRDRRHAAGDRSESAQL